jgi:hypothetical protein
LLAAVAVETFMAAVAVLEATNLLAVFLCLAVLQ